MATRISSSVAALISIFFGIFDFRIRAIRVLLDSRPYYNTVIFAKTQSFSRFFQDTYGLLMIKMKAYDRHCNDNAAQQ